MAGYDIEGARKAGYSDDAIAKDIADFNNIDYSAAIKGGHTNDSIIKSLSVNKNKEAGANAPGATRGLISVLQGPTLGFADEILGGVGGAYDTLTKGGDYLPNYRANRDYLRGAAEYEQKQNPVTTGITQAMASAPLSVLRLFGGAPQVANAMSVPSVNMLGQGMTAAGTGALFGTVGGAGASTADTLGGVGLDALKGGALSAAIGGGSVPIIRGVGAVGGNIAQRFNPARATTAAQLEIAQALARDAEARQIAGNPVIAARTTLPTLGDPAVIADVGGASTRSLLDTMATLPGRTKEAASQFIRQRENVGAAPRMIAAAEESMGVQGQRLAPTLEALTVKQSADAAPIYKQLENVSFRADDELVKILAREPGAHKAAEISARRRGEPYIDLSLIKAGDDIPWWALDKVKKTLWSMADSAKEAVTKKPTDPSRDIESIRVALTDKLDRLSPKDAAGNSIYKKARNAFGEPAELKDALTIGEKALSQTESRISDQIKNFSQAELDAFRIGAFESLRQKLGLSLGGRTEIINAYRNPVMSEKLQTIFGSESAYRQFATKMANEERFRLLNATDKGSQSISRAAAIDDLGMGAFRDVAGVASGVASGSPVGIGQSLLNLFNRTKMPETTRNELGRILLTGGQEGQNNLRAMMQAGERIARQRQESARRAGVFATTPAGAATGAAAYQMVPGIE
tara:strand:+ start:1327 stop:3396 length:2070 start_codon:yes stop_codon:yes gene_type:complete